VTTLSSTSITLSRLLPLPLITLALALAPFFVSTYYLKLLMIIMYWSGMAISWDFFSGLTKYVSLGSSIFFGVGVYSMAIFGQTLPFAIVVLLAIAFGALIALCVGMVTLRLKGVYFSIFTFGLVELIKNVIEWWEINVNFTVGRYIAYFEFNVVYYIVLFGTIAILLLAFYLRNSKLGLALRMIGECEDAAIHVGVDARLYKTLGFIISSLFFTFIGCCISTQWTYIEPKIAFDPTYTFTPVVMALLGGSGTAYGPILGAIIYSLVGELLIFRFKGYYMITFGLTLIFLVLFLPQGIAGAVKKLRSLLEKRARGC